MNVELLAQLLEAVAAGEVPVMDALQKLRRLGYEELEFARLDHHRSLRTGLPEVVWGPGKTPHQIAAILQKLAEHNPVAMATRIEERVYEQVQQECPAVVYHRQARICTLFNPALKRQSLPGQIGLISAGTADLPVAEEAAVTAELCGAKVLRLWDVGVAGLHRLLDNLPLLDEVDVVIVVAGMEGALASVVGGLARAPVIAVPTSIGYGAHFNGLTPLLAMLNSCATGVGVVNIDNGFGAAMLAVKMLQALQRREAKLLDPNQSASDRSGPVR